MKIEDMSVEQLQEHLRKIRHRRTVEKPVAKAKAAKAEKKTTHKRVSAVEKLLAELSPEDQAALIKSLGGENEDPA